MAGALSEYDDQVAPVDDATAVQSMLPDDDTSSAGALSSGGADENPTHYNNIQAASPQEMRDLQALAYTKGMLAPKHTGATMLEGLGQAAENKYALALENMKENAALRQKLAAIATSKNLQKQIAEAQIQGRTDVAKIMAGKSAERLLSDDELKEAGLPPGTSAAVNNFGRIRVLHTPPSAQQMLTGYDDQGKPQYAAPGAALTPAMRSSYQMYLRNANQVKPQLKQLLQDLNSTKSQTSMGIAGGAERLINSTVGQAANLTGLADTPAPFFPKDTALRDRMEKFNEMALPLLEADPRHQAMGIKGKEALGEMLPEPDSSWQDVGTARTKLQSLYDQINSRSDEYNAALKGQGLTDNTPTPPTASSGGEVDEAMIRRHAKEAIANGKDPLAVAKKAKEQFGIDIGVGE